MNSAALDPNGVRRILHVDMDAFFVACEVRRNPVLAGKPVWVGGTGDRGVVAAASYEARQFGIHSAMPSGQAHRLCPHAVVITGDHGYYGEISERVHAVFQSFTPIVEPIALDEAFLDVSGAQRLFGSAPRIAHHIRARISGELNLSCSVGVAPTKMVAKLASEAAKPKAKPEGITPGAGVVIVEPNEVLAFLHAHPVRAMWGVGPKTFERLQRLGVSTIGDLAAIGETALIRALGRSHGRQLFELAMGVDDRPVEPDRGLKSVGHEETFAHDRLSRDELQRDVIRMADAVASRLRANQVLARTVSIKVRFHDFLTITRSVTLPEPVDDAQTIARAAGSLLDLIDPAPGVRLFGVSGSQLSREARQMTLDEMDPGWGQATTAIDEIRKRFGGDSIGPARLAVNGRLELLRRGAMGRSAQAWGPNVSKPDSMDPQRDETGDR